MSYSRRSSLSPAIISHRNHSFKKFFKLKKEKQLSQSFRVKLNQTWNFKKSNSKLFTCKIFLFFFHPQKINYNIINPTKAISIMSQSQKKINSWRICEVNEWSTMDKPRRDEERQKIRRESHKIITLELKATSKNYLFALIYVFLLLFK